MAAEYDDDWAQKGMEHMQAAVREVIQATRTLLDAAEELVDDPKAVQGLLGTLASIAAAAAGRLRPDVAAEDDADDHIQRIDIS